MTFLLPFKNKAREEGQQQAILFCGTKWFDLLWSSIVFQDNKALLLLTLKLIVIEFNTNYFYYYQIKQGVFINQQFKQNSTKFHLKLYFECFKNYTQIYYFYFSFCFQDQMPILPALKRIYNCQNTDPTIRESLYQQYHYNNPIQKRDHDIKLEKVTIVQCKKQQSSQIGQSHLYFKTKKDYFALQKILYFFLINSITKPKKYLTSYQQQLKAKLVGILQQKKAQLIHRQPQVQKKRLRLIERLERTLDLNQNTQKYLGETAQYLDFLANVIYKGENFPIQYRSIYLNEYFSQIFSMQIKITSDYPLIYKQLIIYQNGKISNLQEVKTLNFCSSKQILYKVTTIEIGQLNKIYIKETNQEHFIYFKFTKIQNDQKRQKIIDLFKQNSRQEVYQSQNSSSSSRNSQIVLDQDYYKLSQRLSNTCRKSSFNSGQFLQENQNGIFQKNHVYQSTHAQMSEDRFASHNILKENSYQGKENKQFQKFKSLYTSIDLLVNSNAFSRIITNLQNSKQLKRQDKQRPQIQINLLSEQKKVLFTTNLFSDFIFKEISKNRGIQNRKSLIRRFFKKQSHEKSLQKSQLYYRKYSKHNQFAYSSFLQLKQNLASCKQKAKSLQKMAKIIKIDDQSYFD